MKDSSSITTRYAVDTDLPALTELYNHYIVNTPITFDLNPMSVEQRREWFLHYQTNGPHRLWVAEEGGRLIGYASSSLVRPKAAYLTSIETSIYCHPQHTAKGVGRTLYSCLFASLKGEDVHRAYAGITMPNDVSVGFHQAFDFRPVGVFSEMGRKFDRYWDVLWMEKKL